MALPVLLRTDLWAFEWNWTFKPILCSSAVCKRIFFKTQIWMTLWPYLFSKAFCYFFIHIHMVSLCKVQYTTMQYIWSRCLPLMCYHMPASLRRRLKVYFCKVHIHFVCCLCTSVFGINLVFLPLACLSCVTTCQPVCPWPLKVCFWKVHTHFVCCLYIYIELLITLWPLYHMPASLSLTTKSIFL